jgi:hypothetical protein
MPITKFSVVYVIILMEIMTEEENRINYLNNYLFAVI